MPHGICSRRALALVGVGAALLVSCGQAFTATCVRRRSSGTQRRCCSSLQMDVHDREHGCTRSEVLQQAQTALKLGVMSTVALNTLVQPSPAAAAGADQSLKDAQDKVDIETVGTPKVGSQAPDFDLPSTRGDGERISLNSLSGKWVVMYFYPADFTSGCSIEASRFQKNYAQFQERGAEVLGVSLDDVVSHRSFCSDLKLSFPLLADTGAAVSTLYGALVKDPQYGAFSLRISFLIDPQGVIRYMWPKVTPARHADQVLEVLDQLQSKGGKVVAKKA